MKQILSSKATLKIIASVIVNSPRYQQNIMTDFRLTWNIKMQRDLVPIFYVSLLMTVAGSGVLH